MPHDDEQRNGDRRAIGDTTKSDVVPHDQGLSLDQLSQAYVNLISRGSEPHEDASDNRDDLPDEEPADATEGRESADELCEVTPRSILEAILFVGTPDNTPLSSEQIAALMRGVRPREVDELIRELNDSYHASHSPYAIVAQGAGYRMLLREEFAPLRDKFYGRIRDARLSQAAVDVLAVVAYHQPLPRDELEKLRGRPSGKILTQLVRRQLVRVERTDEKPRRTLYHTTERFLDLFGLESIADLPKNQDLDRDL